MFTPDDRPGNSARFPPTSSCTTLLMSVSFGPEKSPMSLSLTLYRPGGGSKGGLYVPKPECSRYTAIHNTLQLSLSQWMPFRISSPHTTSVAEYVAQQTRVWTNCRFPCKPTYRRSKLKKHDRCEVRYGQRLTVGQLGSGAGQYPSITAPKLTTRYS